MGQTVGQTIWQTIWQTIGQTRVGFGKTRPIQPLGEFVFVLKATRLSLVRSTLRRVATSQGIVLTFDGVQPVVDLVASQPLDSDVVERG